MDGLCALLCAAGILLVRGGAAVHETGSLRAKNAVSGLMRHLGDFSLATLAFWAVGAAFFFASGPGGVLSFNPAYLFQVPPDQAPAALLALGGVLLASGVVGGTLGERARALPVYAASLLLAGLLVPLAAFWARNGWLARLGFHDLAGASYIHWVGAIVAATGSIVVGPRLGKYNRDGSTNGIPGHSVPLACTGAFLMLAGWIPYLAGFAWMSGLGRPWLVGVNALLAAAASSLVSLLVCQWRYGKPDVHLNFGSLLGGLVAVSAAGDVLPSHGAVLTGAIAGLLVPLAMLAFEFLWKIDDPTSVLASRGVAAAWGLLAGGLFAPAPNLLGRLKFLGVQALGLLAIGLLAAALAAGLFALLQRLAPLRSSEADEFDGLDLAEHDIGAYPDFQQNTIKSYHLRET